MKVCERTLEKREGERDVVRQVKKSDSRRVASDLSGFCDLLPTKPRIDFTESLAPPKPSKL